MLPGIDIDPPAAVVVKAAVIVDTIPCDVSP
jgi:hypothetical protein